MSALAGPAEVEAPRRYGIIEGNFAAALGQFQQPEGQRGQLVIDSREILAGTTSLVGACLGEIEVDVNLTTTALYVEQGMREDGAWSTTKGALARAVYGRRGIGGGERAQVHKALLNLYRMELSTSGVSAESGQYVADFVEYERLLVRLRFDRQIRLRTEAPELFDPAQAGAMRDSTVEGAYAQWLVKQVRAGYWRELDWEKLRSLPGVSKTLWLILSSPRLPFVTSASSDSLEELHVPLNMGAYRALGIKAKRPAGCKRTLAEALDRMIRVDGTTYVHGEVVPNPGPEGGYRLSLVRRRAPSDQLVLDWDPGHDVRAA